MQYVVGIDAGATKTQIKIADLQGQLITSGKTVAGNVNLIAPDIFSGALNKKIEALLGGEKLEKTDCCGICIGASGCGNERNREIYLEILDKTELSGVKTAETDAMTALVGAMGEQRGIVLIAGTGSICFGINEKGLRFRAGGWGHVIGDEGSGYHIGRLVLKSIMEAYDQNKPSCLRELLFDSLHISSHEALIQYVYHPETTKKDIARMAVICEAAYHNGDRKAEKILKKAGIKLACLLKVVYQRAFDGKTACSWSYGGSVLEKCVFVRDTACLQLRYEFPQLEMMDPKDDSAFGAVLVALEKLKN